MRFFVSTRTVGLLGTTTELPFVGQVTGKGCILGLFSVCLFFLEKVSSIIAGMIICFVYRFPSNYMLVSIFLTAVLDGESVLQYCTLSVCFLS